MHYKTIPWFPKYSISDTWIVISNEWTFFQSDNWIHKWFLIRKTYLDKNWYERISLKNWSTQKAFWIHQLVMLTFVWPYPNSSYHINHKDWNKNNNCLENLEYITSKENNNHKLLNPNLIYPKWNKHHWWMKRWKLSKLSKRVWQYDINGILVNEYESLWECARITWFNISNIWCTIHQTRQKICHWYTFKYL